MRKRHIGAGARTWSAATLLVAVTLLSASCSSRVPARRVPADQSELEGAVEQENGRRGEEATEGAPLGSGANGLPGASRGAKGTSTPTGSRSGGGLSQGNLTTGFQIAFNRGGGIFAMTPDGSEPKRIIERGAEPAWSPDGKSIAFIGYSDGGVIQWMNADGSGTLQNLPARGFSPTWSPDGRQLAFAWDCHSQSMQACPEGFWPADVTEECGPECGIGIIARDGTGRTHLGTGIWPDWGADGRILYADGVAAEPCAYDQGSMDWTRTGAEPECELPIWVMNADGSGRARLPVDRAIRPTWSRDGRKIAYSTATGDVFTANSDGTGIAKVTPGGKYWSQPSWSPDGLWLALKVKSGTGGTYSSIYLIRTDGTGERRLTSEGDYDSLPAFSPRR